MVRDALDANLGECWVVGEISNARLAPSNHFYFTLKDSRSAINVVMFKSAFNRMRFKAVDGMEVIVRGRVQIFEQRGALQLYAEEMEPRGVGALQVAFEQLKRRLEAEGLFDRARKRAMPYLPRRIGIVTARGGAGLARHVAHLVRSIPEPAGDFQAREGAGRRLRSGDRGCDRRSQSRRPRRGADRWTRRRLARRFVGVQRRDRRAGDFPVGDPGNFRRRPRSGLHDRRFRRRPARAHSHRGRADGRAQSRRVDRARRIARRVARERDATRTVGPARIDGRSGGADTSSRRRYRRGARTRCRDRGRTRASGVLANRGAAAQRPRIAAASSQSRCDGARDAPCDLPARQQSCSWHAVGAGSQAAPARRAGGPARRFVAAESSRSRLRRGDQQDAIRARCSTRPR